MLYSINKEQQVDFINTEANLKETNNIDLFSNKWEDAL